MAVLPSLPQELLDLIIDATYTSNGTTPLETLSRVSRSWRPRSQHHIFKKLRLDYVAMRRIHSEFETSETTENTTSSQQQPTVFSHVRKLRISARQITSPENEPEGHPLEILRFFTNVTSVRILDWDFREFETHHIARFLGHFGSTARTLKIRECYVDSEVLIFLTSLFPLVENLEVDPRYPCSSGSYRIQKSDRPLQHSGFRGTLVFRFLSAQHEEFLAFVTENSSDVRSISAELCVNKGGLQKLFEFRGGNLSSVGVHSLCKQDFVFLTSCTQLQTLSIHLLGDFREDDPNWDALFTVTSPHLEEIKIRSFDGVVTSGQSLVGWEGIDDLLCRHHDRSHQNGVGNFRVSLHPTDIYLEEEYGRLLGCVQEVWPRFVKKGTVVLSLEPYDGESSHHGSCPRVVW